MTVNEQLDKILFDVHNGEQVLLYEEREDVFHQAIDKGEKYRLLSVSGAFVELEPLGYEVVEAGGFDKWKKQREQRENEAHQAALDSAKATEVSAQFASSSAKAAWFSGIVGAIAILISLYQLYKGNEIEDRLNVMTKRAESTDSLMKVLRQNQTTNEQKGNRVLSDSSVRPAVPVSGRGRQEARR